MNNKTEFFIPGNHIHLREFSITDTKRFYKIYPYTISKVAAARWMQHYEDIKHLPIKHTLELAIERKSDDLMIGKIDIVDIDKIEHTAVIGYWIGKDYRKMGYATDAVNTILGYANDELSIKRFTANVSCNNIASRKLLISTGFKPISDKSLPRIDYLYQF